METRINIDDYLNEGIKRLIGNIIKASLGNPHTALFMLNMQKVTIDSRKKKEKYKSMGIHIPAFLISSITEECNLFCNGCYARSNGICGSGKTKKSILSSSQWEAIFSEAADAGILFNILAGGEPLVRKDVIIAAARQKKMIFPIFTNGTLIDSDYVKIFSKNPNLIPVLSIEGFERETDERRGKGIYSKLISVMGNLKKNKILYGASVTVTSNNMTTVTSPDFITGLRESGCKLIFYVEYVPVEKSTEYLVLSDKQKEELEDIITYYKEKYSDMLFISFPGDEKHMGGCLAAGRGFFHINPQGEAEACPFSPYSDRSLTEYTLIEALQSPFFSKLRQAELVGGEHSGGCVLFEREHEVQQLLEY
jgi:MoaA/NifB/PqqE/SkfB family radical SAM enzyme